MKRPHCKEGNDAQVGRKTEATGWLKELILSSLDNLRTKAERSGRCDFRDVTGHLVHLRGLQTLSLFLEQQMGLAAHLTLQVPQENQISPGKSF